MKRIGLVLPDAPQYSETFFNYKIRGLQNSGFDVIVFSGNRSKQKYFFTHHAAYPVYKAKPVKQFFQLSFTILVTLLRSPLKAINLFSAEKKDGNSFIESLKIVYTNAHILPHRLDWLHFGFATMSLKRENVAKVMGARMGVSFRGYDINIYPLKNKDCYMKLWKNIDKVHTISDYLHTKALKLGLSNEIKFAKIPPAVDVSLFRLRNDLGKIKNPLNILTVGRLHWIKNYETTISAMKILKDKNIDFVYNIIGEGKELERLKFAVHQSGLNDRVFLGKMNNNKVMERMSESDIYLQPSLQEGFCVSVLEAQASGLLCIVSDADGLKENVIEGVTGWVVQKRDDEAFAAKIEEVLKLSEEKRRMIAMNARQRVEKDFRMEDQVRKFKEFFTE